MKGEWCYFKSYFSQQDCDNIVSLAETVPEENAKVGVSGELVDSSYRKSKIRFIQKTDQRFNFVFDAIWKMAIQANDEFFSFHLSKLDYLQYTEYDSLYQGEYKKHHDVFWINNDPTYHRKLSCVIQLSDPQDYEGGNFEVYDTTYPLDSSIIKDRGTVIFIPSFTTHAVSPVTSGFRRSLVAWIDGPKWR